MTSNYRKRRRDDSRDRDRGRDRDDRPSHYKSKEPKDRSSNKQKMTKAFYDAVMSLRAYREAREIAEENPDRNIEYFRKYPGMSWVGGIDDLCDWFEPTPVARDTTQDDRRMTVEPNITTRPARHGRHDSSRVSSRASVYSRESSTPNITVEDEEEDTDIHDQITKETTKDTTETSENEDLGEGKQKED